MGRRMIFDVDVGVPAAVMYADFTTERYWQDLVVFYEQHGANAEIAHFSSGEGGTDIAFNHILHATDLPVIARAVVPSTFVVTREQHFEPFVPSTQQATGHYRAAVPVAPVDIRGEYLLADTETGSRMRLQTECTVRAPLIGGQIEQLVLGGLQTLFASEGEFTADWIAGHH